jgi:hypothetical protein
MARKPKVTTAAKKATVHTAKKTGLQLSAAQWKVYSKVYTSTARRLAQAAAVQTLRKSRLTANTTMQKKAAAAKSSAATARIAAFAARTSYRQSVLAHQNTALRHRVYANMEQHLRVAGRLQYIAGGEAAYAHTAVMRTLTTAQATTVQAAIFARALKTAKAATAAATAPTAAGTALNTAAKAAATAAARKSPVGRTAPRPDGLAAAESWQESPWCGAWRGDPDGYDCVAAAVANSLMLDRRFAHSDVRYTILRDELGQWPGGPSIAQALEHVQRSWKFTDMPWLTGYEPDDPALAAAGSVIGFATATGPHAALYLGAGLIASWGEVLLLADVMTGEVEESWDLTWGTVS